MKNTQLFVLIILAGFMVFGCAGMIPGSSQGSNQTGGIGSMGLPIQGESEGEKCQPDYSFSDVDSAVLGQSVELTATVSCAAGKTFTVKLDGEEVADATADSNETTSLNLGFVPAKDGTLELVIESDDETLQTTEVEVTPIGNQQTSGSDSDVVSFKEWRAVAFETETPITPAEIQIYMKRLETGVTTDSMVVELRADSNGEPGPLVASAEKPVNSATLTYNWIKFELSDRPEIPVGKYWIVMKVDEDTPTPVSDTFYVHYTLIDKNEPGNENTIKMSLTVDSGTSDTTETDWETLTFDRQYSVVLTTQN